ncbi:MAG: AEC family transporter [Spirochaetia bacterium]|nr:AEC family transporter [Spirochaetia bacterium]MBO7093768.1 AEC family transporter [Spirochaetia bacterium]
MLQSFTTVFQQIVILFIMIGVGYVCSKRGFLSPLTIKELSKFIIYVVTPCIVVESFHRPFDSSMLGNMGIACAAAIGAHLLNIILSRVLIRDKEQNRRVVYQFATIFSNCGFMGLPLQYAILGTDGVFYGAVFIAVFNVFTWTYGFTMMGSKGQKLKFKEILLNPGVLGVTAGLIIFINSLQIPHVLLVPIKSFAALNTPLPMVVVGYYLAQITSLKVLKDRYLVITQAVKLLAAPLLALLMFYLAGIRGLLLISLVISASAPSAANTVMFSVLFNRDTKLAVTLVSVSVLISLFTMPLVISLAMAAA